MIPLLLTGLAQLDQPTPHATMHPADAINFAVFHDLTSIAEAYDQAPLLRFARDESVLEALANATGMSVDPAMISLPLLFDMAMANLPLEAQMFDVEGMLRDLRKISVSSQIEGGPEAFVARLTDQLSAAIELSQLSDAVDGFEWETGTRPTTLEELIGDDAAFGIDPWGNAFQFEATASGLVFTSLGADGVESADDLVLGAGVGPDQAFVDAVAPLLDDVGFTIALEFVDEARLDQVFGLIDGAVEGFPVEAGAEPILLEHDGTTLEGHRFQIDGRVLDPATGGLTIDLWIGRHGPHLLVGFQSCTPERTFALLAGDEPSMAKSTAFLDGIAALPERNGTSILTRFDQYTEMYLYDLFVDRLIGSGVAECFAREIETELPSANALARMQGFFQPDTRPRFARNTFAGGEFHFDSLQPGATLPSATFPTTALSSEELGVIKESAALVWSSHVDLGSVYDEVLGLTAELRGIEPEAYHAAGVEAVGFDLRETLLGHLESAFVVTMDPIAGIGAPELMVYARTSNPEELSASISTLFESIAAAAPEEFEAKTRPYRGMPLSRLALRGLDLGLVSIEPTIGIVGDVVVVGLSGVHVKKELKRLDAGKFEQHVLSDPTAGHIDGDTNQIFYLDWASFLASAYDLGRAAASFPGAGLDQLPVDMATLPSSSLFVDYFVPTIYTTRQAPAGERVHLRGAVGPEFALAVQAASLGLRASEAESEIVWGVVERDSEDGWELEVEAPTPAMVTDEALTELRIALQIYFYESPSTFPDSLEALAEPTTNFPRGCLDGDSIPTDGWGQAFLYAAADDGSGYTLWSVGPDGVDQKGGGDDVAVVVR
ncbi:MAG: type II secretion system protein GspG [Planctomycetota bacterium]|jgi:hypothetical protein